LIKSRRASLQLEFGLCMHASAMDSHLKPNQYYTNSLDESKFDVDNNVNIAREDINVAIPRSQRHDDNTSSLMRRTLASRLRRVLTLMEKRLQLLQLQTSFHYRKYDTPQQSRKQQRSHSLITRSLF